MSGQVSIVLLLLATTGHAANLPRFAFTFPGATLARTAIALDSRGNTYLAGSVTGNWFTATPGAFQSRYAGSGNCIGGIGMGPPVMIPCRSSFVNKLDAMGAVVFATYLGGTGNAEALA